MSSGASTLEARLLLLGHLNCDDALDPKKRLARAGAAQLWSGEAELQAGMINKILPTALHCSLQYLAEETRVFICTLNIYVDRHPSPLRARCDAA